MNPSGKKKKALDTYAKYSSIAFQMLAIILVGVFGGRELDRWLQWQFPAFTMLLAVLSVILAMYTVIKEFFRK
jgi:F0F1-type ATP synthase assembly protein I